MSAYTARVRPDYDYSTRYATLDQIKYLEDLLTQNKLYDGHYDRLWSILEAHRIDLRTPGDGTRMERDTASAAIDWMKRQIAKAAGPVTYIDRAAGGNKQAAGLYLVPATPTAVRFGVYRKDGTVYVVKPNKTGTKVYAKKLVESAPRMTEAGEVVDFELEYAPGMVYKLTEADRVPLADAKDLMTRYGKCIVCSRHLKAAKSVEAGIGPVCAKSFS